MRRLFLDIIMELNSSSRTYISAGVVVLSVFLWNHASFFFFSCGLISSMCFGISTYFLLRVSLSPKGNIVTKFPASIIKTRETILDHSDQVLYDKVDEEWKPLFGHCIDSVLNDLVVTINKDFILKWFGFLFKGEVLGCRMESIDYYKFFIGDVLKIFHSHLERIRTASQQNNKCFYIHAYLSDRNKELKFLERLAEFLVLESFPKELRPVRSLLKEVLAHKLMSPLFEIITNPDFINRKIISFVGKNRLKLDLKKRTVNYSEELNIFRDNDAYKRCIESIIKSNDIEELKQIRYNMVSAIIKATAVNNLSNDKFSNNFTKYINRLMNAKNICDKRLYELGDEVPSSSGQKLFWDSLLDDSNCLSFRAIMSSAFTRRYFYYFLAEENQEALLGFWSAVEELKESDKTLWHQLATEIFYTYIHGKDGNTGPDVFYQVQEEVSKTLEQEYYHLFLVSEICYNMIEDAQNSGISITDKYSKSTSLSVQEDGKTEDSISQDVEENSKPNDSFTFSDHSTFARSHLSRINEKHRNKSQALKALKKSLKPDSKVLNLLKDELEHLGSQKKEVESHLSKTESWMERIGQWRSHCQSVRHLPGDSDDFEAVLIIFVPITNANDISSCTGPSSWTLVRRGHEINSFHKEITPYVTWIKNMEVPSTPKSIFSRQPNKAGLEKTRMMVQQYMDTVLNDEQLNHSEAVYSFLSPSPDHLKRLGSVISSKNQSLMNRFRLPDFFKSNGSEKKDAKEGLNQTVNQLQFESDSHSKYDLKQDEDLFLPSFKSNKIESTVVAEDDVLDSFYNLIGEVFNMKGVFKWLRKSLMTFVQITYGSTINRQLRETVIRLTSETMVVSYIRSINKALSKYNASASKKVNLNSEEDARAEAKKLLLLNIPEFMHSLVGQQTARNGVIRVFETLQDKTLNKHLFMK
ncbi:SNX25 [Lepeophtheirus salmonis]|uniref:SNX25 n=1 Tax=Lepeophtheirus salmonis TaxID=72036 RepID=A0A7R8CZQ9_LEPSM|nr:SNX25 [Lepeophtheirus salmonis]CAF2936460.1 SNX25 [Lepeophtheirus salmonis]